MSHSAKKNLQGQQGLTLIELLVGLALISMFVTIGYMGMDALQKSFVKTTNQLEIQNQLRDVNDQIIRVIKKEKHAIPAINSIYRDPGITDLVCSAKATASTSDQTLLEYGNNLIRFDYDGNRVTAIKKLSSSGTEVIYQPITMLNNTYISNIQACLSTQTGGSSEVATNLMLQLTLSDGFTKSFSTKFALVDWSNALNGQMGFVNDSGSNGGSGEGGGSGSNNNNSEPGPVTPYQSTGIDSTSSNNFNSTTEQFDSSTTNYQTYVTWDANNLYIGINGADVSSSATESSFKFIQIYISGVNGSKSGVKFNTQQPRLSFDATYHFQYKVSDGSLIMNKWSGTSWSNATSEWTGSRTARNNTFIKFIIPRANIGNPNTVSVNTLFMNEKSMSEKTYAVMPSGAYSDAYSASPLLSTAYHFDLKGGSAPVTQTAYQFKITSATDTTVNFSFLASANATSVKIEQSSDGGSTWTNSTLANSLSASSTSAAVTGLTMSSTNLFRLRVTGGEKAGMSTAERPLPYSNTVKIDNVNTLDVSNGFKSTEISDTSTGDCKVYITWDERNIYVGYSGSSNDVGSGSANKWILMYLSGSGGTKNALTYAGTINHSFPFYTKYHFRWKANDAYTNLQTWSGSAWANSTWNGDKIKNGNYVEFSIPRANIGNPDGTLKAIVYMLDESNRHAWGAAPNNSFTNGTTPTFSYYFNIDLRSVSYSRSASNVVEQ